MPAPVIAAAVAAVGEVILAVVKVVETIRIGMQRQPGIDETAAHRMRQR